MPADSESTPRRRPWRKVAWLAAALAAVVVTHSWLLTALANLLIADHPRPTADYTVLFLENVSGANAPLFDAAAAAVADAPHRKILLIEPRPRRMQHYGILPTAIADSRRELTARGVPDAAVEELDGPADDFWQAARLLDKWLADRPHAEIEIYGNRFGSRNWTAIAGRVISADASHRVFFRPFTAREFDEHNWWNNRDGWKSFMFAHLDLLYTRIHGEPEPYVSPWTPENFTRELAAARDRE